MSDRVFKVFITKGGDLAVSDNKDIYEQRPQAVIFPVSMLYDKETQTKRARDYANYLNKLNEAAEVAYDQIHLVDVLKR